MNTHTFHNLNINSNKAKLLTIFCLEFYWISLSFIRCVVLHSNRYGIQLEIGVFGSYFSLSSAYRPATNQRVVCQQTLINFKLISISRNYCYCICSCLITENEFHQIAKLMQKRIHFMNNFTEYFSAQITRK